MKDKTLEGRKMDAYVLLKILKYCTNSPARSYQMKYAVDRVFTNKSIDSTKDLGPSIKKIIHYMTIRGKFSSVHPDLAAEGITRVEVGEEGLHFVTKRGKGGISANLKTKAHVLFQGLGTKRQSVTHKKVRMRCLEGRSQCLWRCRLSQTSRRRRRRVIAGKSAMSFNVE